MSAYRGLTQKEQGMIKAMGNSLTDDECAYNQQEDWYSLKYLGDLVKRVEDIGLNKDSITVWEGIFDIAIAEEDATEGNLLHTIFEDGKLHNVKSLTEIRKDLY